MQWDAIGAIGEILGALAVVVSLFYVGSQVRQNAKAIRGQTYESLSMALADSAIQAANDPDVMEAMARAINGEDLSIDQNARYVSLIRAYTRMASAAHYQYSLGLLDDEQLRELVSSTAIHISTPSGQRVWEATREWHSEAFAKYIEKAVKSASRDKIAKVMPIRS